MKNSGKSKILQQLLPPIMLVIIIPTILIVGIMGAFFYRSYQNQVVTGSMSETSLIADNVASFISEAYTLSEELAKNPSILTMDTAIQTPILEDCVARNPYLELLYIQGTTGMQTGRSNGGALADRSERWWFRQVVADKLSFVSKSYYSVNTGSPCTSIFFPMYRDDEFIGVFATDIKLETLVSIVTEYSDPANDKIVFIIDGEGTVVAHPDTTYIEELYNYVTYTKTVSVKDEAGNVMTDADGNILEQEEPITCSDSFEKMLTTVMSGIGGSSIVTENGSIYYASYAPIIMDGTSDSWAVITMQKRGTLMRPLYIVLAIALGIAALALILSIVFIRSTVRKITNPILEITDIIGVASEGDFSVKAKVTNDTEVGKLAAGFNHMTDKVSRVLHETVRLLEDVKGSAVKLSGISENSGLVADDMAKISDGAVNQTADTDRVVRLTEHLKDCNEKLQEMRTRMMEETEDTKRLSDEGIQYVTELKQKSEGSLDAVEQSYDKVLHLNESSAQIGDIIQKIGSISSQTRLLALNASIEAARAGEHGRGFAVVAEQVTALALDSTAATGNIEKIVTQIRQDIAEIVEKIDGIKETFEEQIASVENVEQSFVSFREASENSIQTVRVVGELIGTVDTINQDVVSSIDNIHDISRQTEENAKEISVRMEKQKDDINEIAQKVENMNAASTLLEEEMSKFTLVETEESRTIH